MWMWLKQSSFKRSRSLGVSTQYPDTCKIAKLVIEQLQWGCDINRLISEINPGLPQSVMKNLLEEPVGE